MRKMLVAAIAAAVIPMASRAQFTLGARVGFAPAMGDAVKDGPMSDGVKSQIPIQIDAAYRITPEIAVGVYGAYGLGQLAADVCPEPADCSARTIRAGVEAFYTFRNVSRQFVPWAGVGIGYETGTLTVEYGGLEADETYSGFEFLNVQVGGDYKVNEQFSIGPYLMLSLGQYSTQKMDNEFDPASNVDGSITDKAFHEWLNFGVRGKFDL